MGVWEVWEVWGVWGVWGDWEIGRLELSIAKLLNHYSLFTIHH